MKLFPNFTSISFDYLLISWVKNYVYSNRGFLTSLSLQNLWLFLLAFNLTETNTRLSFDETVTRVQHYYAFHEEASLKVQGIKGSTSQTQGRDGTLSATTLNSVKMILEGLTRLRTKVVELSPNFIQHLDVVSLLTLFVENFFSSMRGGI